MQKSNEKCHACAGESDHDHDHNHDDDHDNDNDNEHHHDDDHDHDDEHDNDNEHDDDNDHDHGWLHLSCTITWLGLMTWQRLVEGFTRINCLWASEESTEELGFKLALPCQLAAGQRLGNICMK